MTRRPPPAPVLALAVLAALVEAVLEVAEGRLVLQAIAGAQ